MGASCCAKEGGKGGFALEAIALQDDNPHDADQGGSAQSYAVYVPELTGGILPDRSDVKNNGWDGRLVDLREDDGRRNICEGAGHGRCPARIICFKADFRA